jgi:hypothetical protein
MRRGVAIVGVTALVLSGCARSGSPQPAPADTVGSTTAIQATSTQATSTQSTGPSSGTTGTSSTAPNADGYAFPYQPMWPFTERAEADRWLTEGRPTGDSAWHADPRATALTFTREFLGFTDLDRTTVVTEQPREAWVGVGQADPMGNAMTVANLHLARLGPAADAPWEVVGTEDTDLTLERPAYGSPVQPVVEVGGTISGVDESLHIQARQPSAMVGEFCCVPAGGERAPWSATLPIGATKAGAVTVVVSTGGHYALIERFAITALRAD